MAMRQNEYCFHCKENIRRFNYAIHTIIYRIDSSPRVEQQLGP